MALFNKTFLLAVGCCFEDSNNPGQCLCTGTEIDDPATPGSCCKDDVDNPGNGTTQLDIQYPAPLQDIQF